MHSAVLQSLLTSTRQMCVISTVYLLLCRAVFRASRRNDPDLTRPLQIVNPNTMITSNIICFVSDVDLLTYTASDCGFSLLLRCLISLGVLVC